MVYSRYLFTIFVAVFLQINDTKLYGDDKQHLLQNLNITQSDTEIVIKNEDTDEKLISSQKSEFISTNLSLTDETFTTVPSGFDIKITIKNDTPKPKHLLFEIKIPGIKFGSDNSLNVLNTQTYMVPKIRHFKLNKPLNINPVADKNKGVYVEEHISYPRGYSPVIVAHNGKFAVGAAILTSFNKEKIALQQLVKHNKDNSWSFIFKNTKVDNHLRDGVGIRKFPAKLIEAGSSETIKITVRFSKDENWIYTLAPYKEFFNNRFSDKHIVERDTTPILGMTFSWSSIRQNKSKNDDKHTMLYRKGYINNGKYFKKHSDTYAKELYNEMNKKNYKRVMFWAVSGQYYGYDYFDKKECKNDGHSKKECIDNFSINKTFNIPTQFLDNLDPSISTIVNKIKTNFKDIDYGFWWGRSGQVPKLNGNIINQDDWNPDDIVASDIKHNPYHLDYTKKLLKKALDLGAKEIGLDAFSNMDISSQFQWIKKIKSYIKQNQHKDVKLMQEGVICDYLHTEFSIFLQPNNKWFNRDKEANFNKPPVLANYLNSDKAEIIVWLNGIRSKPDNKKYYVEKIDNLRNLGFTPLLEIKNGYMHNIPEI